MTHDATHLLIEDRQTTASPDEELIMIPRSDDLIARHNLRVATPLLATLLASSCFQGGAACSIEAPCQGATTCHVATGRCVPIAPKNDARLIADRDTSRVEHPASPLPDRGLALRSDSSTTIEGRTDGALEAGDQNHDATSFIPCFDDSECPTGYCVRHVCCDIPCQIPCVSCVVPGHVGICTPVPCHDTP